MMIWDGIITVIVLGIVALSGWGVIRDQVWWRSRALLVAWALASAAAVVGLVLLWLARHG